MPESIDTHLLMSGLSLVVTCYFWLIKSRRERPCLQFHQLAHFRKSCRRHPQHEATKRLCLRQQDTGGVLVVNHSTRQNSIVLFDCFLLTESGVIQGDWGFCGDDRPPWNVAPESSIAFSPACFFDLPDNFEVPENPEFEIQFITASGKRFSHRFTEQAPRFSDVAGSATDLEKAA